MGHPDLRHQVERQPSGIKWAVRTAVNGTVASTVTTTGKATTMSLRATVVKRFGKRAVAVSVPGATFVVPMRRGAVWLPGGKLTNAVAPVGAMGSVSVFRLAVDARGRVAVASAKQVALPKPQGAVPFAGKVTGVSMTDRTITIQASTLAGYPVTLVVTVPMAFDLLRYPIGAQVAGTVVPADPASSTALFATSVTLNRSFAAADSPLGTIVATPPDPADIAAIDALQAAWRAGNDTGKFTQAGTGLFTSKMERLDRIQRWIEWNDISTATRELGIFEADVNAANTNPAVKPPATITDVAFQQAVIAQSAALRTQITAP